MTKENAVRWVKAAGIRAIRTFFQAFLASIGSAAVFSEVNWATVLSSAGLAAVLSIATSFATKLPELE